MTDSGLMRGTDEMTRAGIFLHFGFIPELSSAFETAPWSTIRRDEQATEAGRTRDEWVDAGIEAFKAACTPTGAGLQVVPLSGGVDSRLILGSLIDAGFKDRVLAVTFGVPGAMDFDMAATVARRAGVRHESLNLEEVELDESQFVDVIANGCTWSHVFEGVFNHLIPLRYGSDATYWSGVAANGLNGSRLSPPGESWDDACRRFAKRAVGGRSPELTPPGFDARSFLPKAPIIGDSVLTPYEQLHIAFRYGCRYDRALIRTGVPYQMPFRHPMWVDFILRAPRPYREDQSLYKDIAIRSQPDLFELPTKSNYGAPLGAPAWRSLLGRASLKAKRSVRPFLPEWMRGVPAGANYLDFDESFRRRPSLQKLVEAHLERLRDRGVAPWLDPFDLWQRHLRREGDYGEELCLLVTLEANLGGL